MALYFETAVRYDKMLENGKVKKTTEKFLVDALSFAEAEARTTQERTPYMSGDFDVKAAKKTKIAEIFNLGAERYYLAKVAFITIDEETAQEKRSISHILVGASDFKEAYDNFLDKMGDTLADFELVSLSETQIIEVYPAII
ncbi:MAG: DUF4494 domain-containing protein [Bacteroidales bacterium]|nr:DUF4494 domain-containing protein [Bacteroidales bacterium]